MDGAQPQTAAVTVRCPGQGIVRTTDVRVSERTPLVQIRQKFFGPIYNELAEDVSCIRAFRVTLQSSFMSHTVLVG